MTPGVPRHSGSARSSRLPAPLRRALVPVALLGGALVLGGCTTPTFGAFRGATVQGKDEFKLWVGMAITGLVVAALVWGLIFWAILRYRRKHDGEMPRQFHEHIPLEIIYTVLPVIIVGVIFYFTVVTENEVDAVAKKPAETVHVLAFRWGWRFTYYDASGRFQGVTVETSAPPQLLAKPATSKQYPQLVLPQGENVKIVLNSSDVVHGFYVPAFNFSRYALPGVTNVFDFTPTQPGVFRGQCTQYCGLYHAEMLFSDRVESPTAFGSWLTSAQAAQAQSGAGA